jgi:nucleoid DNA-binding protein
MALTKSELIKEISEEVEGITSTDIKAVIDALALIAEDELVNGEDFTVPGVCKIYWTYKAPTKKGQRWKKGETVVGFGGISAVKDADSPATKSKIVMRLSAQGPVRLVKPKNSEASQVEFARTTTAKAVVKRLAK